jgi:hypothetical protein
MIHAYVTTIAATAMTINSSVASIGEIPFFDARVLFVKLISPVVISRFRDFLFNLYESEIHIADHFRV